MLNVHSLESPTVQVLNVHSLESINTIPTEKPWTNFDHHNSGNPELATSICWVSPNISVHTYLL